MSKFILADGSASINSELSLLAEKEYILPLSKKHTTESLKTALYELLMYADTAKEQDKQIDKLNKVLSDIARINATDYEYQKWAKEALAELKG